MGYKNVRNAHTVVEWYTNTINEIMKNFNSSKDEEVYGIDDALKQLEKHFGKVVDDLIYIYGRQGLLKLDQQ